MSSRGRSRSRKKIKSVKRNIFKQTNGFRNTEPTAIILKSKRSVSRKSRSRPKSKSSVSHKRSTSQISNTRMNEVGKKCKKLMNHKFKVTKSIKTAMSQLRMPQLRMRSTSKGKVKRSKSRKSKSKSKKKLTKKRTKSKSKSKSKVMKKSKSPSNRGSKGDV